MGQEREAGIWNIDHILSDENNLKIVCEALDLIDVQGPVPPKEQIALCFTEQ